MQGTNLIAGIDTFSEPKMDTVLRCVKQVNLVFTKLVLTEMFKIYLLHRQIVFLNQILRHHVVC
jgi:hypothetical protein